MSWPPLDQHIAVLYFYVISVSETQEQLLRLLSWAISHLSISLRKNMILIETARDQHGQMCEALSELDESITMIITLVEGTRLHLNCIYRKFEKPQSPA